MDGAELVGAVAFSDEVLQLLVSACVVGTEILQWRVVDRSSALLVDAKIFADTAASLLEQISPEPPRLGGKRAARIETGHWGRGGPDGVKLAVVRHY